MNIRAAKDETSLLFPANISYASPALNVPYGAGKPRASTLGRTVMQVLTWVAELPKRHRVLTELEMMSDRELADIGLGRGELSKVFQPSFVAARATARAKSAPHRIAGAA